MTPKNELPKSYGIHDLLTVRTNTQLPIPEYFGGRAASGEVELEIHEGRSFPFEPPPYARRLASHRYWYDDGTLTVAYPTTPSGKPIAVRLEALHEARTKLHYTPAFRRMVDFAQLVEGLLTMKLLDAGIALIHAGGLVTDGRATVLASMGRMGKTSTILSVLSANPDAAFMGDNVILVDRDSHAHAWPATVGIFPGTAVPESRIPPQTRRRIMAKRLVAKSDRLVALLLHKLSVDLSESVDPNHLTEIVDEAPIGHLYILNGGRERAKERGLSVSPAVAKIATATDMELDPANYYLSLYAFAGDRPALHPARVKFRREEILEEALADISIQEIFGADVSSYADRIQL